MTSLRQLSVWVGWATFRVCACHVSSAEVRKSSKRILLKSKKRMLPEMAYTAVDMHMFALYTEALVITNYKLTSKKS